jgi:hypothetical protein
VVRLRDRIEDRNRGKSRDREKRGRIGEGTESQEGRSPETVPVACLWCQIEVEFLAPARGSPKAMGVRENFLCINHWKSDFFGRFHDDFLDP